MQNSVEQFIKDAKKGAQFASIKLTSDVKMLKTNNPLASENVTYIASYTILSNISYSNMVNNQQKREGTEEPNFVSKKLWGGAAEYYYYGDFGPLAVHLKKGTKYFSYSPLKTLSFEYFVNGLPATEEQISTIKEFLPKKKVATNQGTEKEIKWRLVTLKNILTLKMGGEIWGK